MNVSMNDSSAFGRMMAELMCKTMIDIQHAFDERRQREQSLEEHLQQTGKYDRTILEYTRYKPNQELDDWLKELLIDAALEKKDCAMFLELTTPKLEGW